MAVINYISQIFSPVESLGMEIQTIQSAVAGIHRINEFFGLEEKENGAQENGDTEKTWNNPATKIEENRNEKISRKEAMADMEKKGTDWELLAEISSVCRIPECNLRL